MDEAYSSYQKKAYNRALTLITQHYGVGMTVVDFGPAPAGLFRIQVIEKGESQTQDIYLLSDLEHLIEGPLLSPNHTQTNTQVAVSDEGLPVQPNLVKHQLISQFKQLLGNHTSDSSSLTKKKSQPLLGNTAASILRNTHSDPLPASSNSVLFKNQSHSLPEHFEKIKQLNVLSFGNGKKELYAFVDLNCPACRQAHKTLEKLDLSEVTIHFIPVAILGEDSEMKASLTLAPIDNQDRLDAFHYLMQNRRASELVDIEVDQVFIDQGWQRYKSNTLAFLDLPRPVTPTFAVMSESGPIIQAAVNKRQLQRLVDLAVPNSRSE